jgi:hypothetical protein
MSANCTGLFGIKVTPIVNILSGDTERMTEDIIQGQAETPDDFQTMLV